MCTLLPKMGRGHAAHDNLLSPLELKFYGLGGCLNLDQRISSKKVKLKGMLRLIRPECVRYL